MKKLKLNFDGIKDMLSKEQMKKIKGGYSSSIDNGTCSVTVICVPGHRDKDITCSGSGGKCFHSDQPSGWVQCDDGAKTSC